GVALLGQPLECALRSALAQLQPFLFPRHSPSPSGRGYFGSRRRPLNSTALVSLSLMKKRKGWSALNTFGSCGSMTAAQRAIPTALAAAASVPSSLTSANAL